MDMIDSLLSDEVPTPVSKSVRKRLILRGAVSHVGTDDGQPLVRSCTPTSTGVSLAVDGSVGPLATPNTSLSTGVSIVGRKFVTSHHVLVPVSVLAVYF